MNIDHIAIPSTDIAATVEWYVSRFGAGVLYQDSTWAFLQLPNVKLAIVSPNQHPPHVAFRVTPEELEQAARDAGKPIDRHRDGTTGIYLADPFGNAVELICYPPGETVYGSPAKPSGH
jgi:catechol 2,3-dioxygenase-like lactoylglutathione lyase family enzyme